MTMQANIDIIDKGILELLQKNCKIAIERIAKDLNLPKSTIQYRIKRLEAEGVIEGYKAKINAARIGKDYPTITFVHIKKGGRKNWERIGNLLAQIPGVIGVYFVAGENDFVVICVSNNREDYLEKLEIMNTVEGIVRTNTVAVMKTIKEDCTLIL
jgi:Lrp/AsnC family leucine-responsive transcriptional regulator